MRSPWPTSWRCPPLPVLFFSVLILALAETAGAIIGRYRGDINTWLTEAVSRRPEVHGLTGSRDYDAELIPQIVFQSEAGLSFFHTHGEGMALVVLAGGTVVSSLVASRAARGFLNVLLAAGVVFPLGFLAYAGLIVPMGVDPAVDWAERWILIPAGSAVTAAFALLALALVVQGVRARGARKGSAPATR
ncbi:MAG TPA: hypothetical protein VED18_10165 [Candidatus Sulfotelmatobacter sp.]|nr:hypothetical protein [Candidatus Sulfotelmatobacter sp.]